MKGDSRTRPTLLFPSTLTEYKGAHFLAEWLSGETIAAQAQWLVPNSFHPSCGRGLRRKLEQLLTELPNVEWLDGIHRNDMPGLYRRADMTIMPITRQEGFGLAALESMSAGVPVICTDVPALNEFIVPDETGFLVPLDQALGRIPELVSQLHLDRREVARRVADQARVQVVEKFGRDRVLGAFGEIARGSPASVLLSD